MNIREDRERFMRMSSEERKADILRAMSDAVKEYARRIAMMKAIAYRNNDVAPKEFDAVFEKELSRAWDGVKDKEMHELAIMGLLEMATHGVDISEIL